MIFSSLDEAIAYIEKAIQKAMMPLSREIKQIMDDITRQQVRGWSGDIFSSVIAKNGSNFAEAGFENTRQLV